MSEVSYAVEGWGDEPVAERIISRAGHEPREILTAGGKPSLDTKLPGYNRSVQHRRRLVRRELDQDDTTTYLADLRSGLVGSEVAPGLALQFAVRSVESWLLADVEGFSDFFHVHVGRIPRDSNALPNPRIADLDRAATESPSLARAIADVERIAGRAP